MTIIGPVPGAVQGAGRPKRPDETTSKDSGSARSPERKGAEAAAWTGVDAHVCSAEKRNGYPKAEKGRGVCYVQTDPRAAWTTVTAGEVTGPESVQGGGQGGRGGTGGGSHAFPLEKWGSRARNRQFTEQRKLGGGTTLVPLDLPKRHLMVPCPALRCVTLSFSLVLPCGRLPRLRGRPIRAAFHVQP